MGMTCGVTSKDLKTDLPAESRPVNARRGAGSGAFASSVWATASPPIAAAPAAAENIRKARRRSASATSSDGCCCFGMASSPMTFDESSTLCKPRYNSSMSHAETVVDQFTRQASAFTAAPQIQDTEALDLLLKATGAGPSDTSLDVACGPGIVACHFARVVRHATGIDITASMLDKARDQQA